jgi:hypothetical protein
MSVLMHKVRMDLSGPSIDVKLKERKKEERNYSSCTGRRSENLCSSSGGSQEKRKTG